MGRGDAVKDLGPVNTEVSDDEPKDGAGDAPLGKKYLPPLRNSGDKCISTPPPLPPPAESPTPLKISSCFSIVGESDYGPRDCPT